MPPRLVHRRVPILDRGVLDLGVIHGHQLDDRRVKLILITLRRRAADMAASLGDDEGPLELVFAALMRKYVDNSMGQRVSSGM